MQKLLFLLIIPFLTRAQPTLFADSINPEYGDRFTTKKGQYIAPGNSGGNQTWDLSALTITNTSVVNATYPSWEYASNFSSNLYLDFYCQVSSTRLKKTGGQEIIGKIGYDDPQDLLRFPFAVNDSFTDLYEGKNYSKNFGTHYVTGTTTVIYDGWGTLILPTGTITNVARVHTVKKYVIDHSSLVTINEEYGWYKNGQHLPVAGVRTMTSSEVPLVQPYSFYTEYELIPVGMKELNTKEHELVVFPNPASAILKIKGGAKRESITVIDCQGKIMNVECLVADENSVSINISTFTNGLYSILIRENDGRISSSKFSVLH